MIRALYTAASGMSAQQMNLDTIANNLANSSTTGFRQLAASVSGHGLPEPGDSGCGAEPEHGLSRTADWPGNKIGCHRDHFISRRAERNTESAGCRNRRCRVLPGAAARRNDCVHARGAVSPE